MNRMGLDIIKIKSFSTRNTQKARSSDSAPKIQHQDSTKAIPHKVMTNREFLSPLKLKAIRMSPKKEEGVNMSETARDGKQVRRVFKKRADEYLYKRLEGT